MPGILTIRTCSTSSISSVEEISRIRVSGTVHTQACGRIPELTVKIIRTIRSTITLKSTSSFILLV